MIEVAGNILPVMGYGTCTAVLMAALFVAEYFAIFRVDGAVAVRRDFTMCPGRIIEAEVRACAQVAIELLHIVALGLCFIEFTEIGFVMDHGIEIKIVDDRLFVEPFFQELVNNVPMFYGMLLEPMKIRHAATIPKYVTIQD